MIHIFHRCDSQESAWRDSKSRVTFNFRGPRKAPGNGDRTRTRATAEAAEIRKKDRQDSEGGCPGKKRESQAEPTFSGRPAEPRPPGHGAANGDERPQGRTKPDRNSPRTARSTKTTGQGTQAGPQGNVMDPRDRPGPKGSGRNPLRERPKPSPAREPTRRNGARRAGGTAPSGSATCMPWPNGPGPRKRADSSGSIPGWPRDRFASAAIFPITASNGPSVPRRNGRWISFVRSGRMSKAPSWECPAGRCMPPVIHTSAR